MVTTTEFPAPAPPKKLPPWVQRLIDLGLTALAIFVAAKYGIVIPTPAPAPVQPAPQVQPLVVVVGQPATVGPVMAQK